MDATIIKLDALPDPVRPPAQDHNFFPGADLHLVLCVVGRVIVGRILHTAHGHRFITLDDPQGKATLPDLFFRD